MLSLRGLCGLETVRIFLFVILSSVSMLCHAQNMNGPVPRRIEERFGTILREINQLKAENADLKARVSHLENCVPECRLRPTDPSLPVPTSPTGRRCSCLHDGRCDAGGRCQCPEGHGGPTCGVTCSNPCLLRGPDPGQSPCDRNPSTRFYFDRAKGACRPFQYSGCGGNANNFPSAASCDARCVRGACCSVTTNVTLNVHLSVRCRDMSESQCRNRGDVVTFQAGLPSVKVRVVIVDQCMDIKGDVHSVGTEVRMGCQRCQCIEDQGLTRWMCRCDRVIQRRELRDLRPTEVMTWQAALRQLRQDGTNVTSPWEELRDLYVKHVMVAQNPRYFLAWHRMYLKLVEQRLQEIDCSLTIPYFDFTTDSGALHKAIIWQPNYFGGRSNPGSCVTDHPFGRNNNSRFCIERPFNRSVAVPTILDVMYVLKTNSLPQLSKSLQAIMAHVHMYIGGTMMTSSSPLDPVFLSLYAFIDHLFWQWQRQHPDIPKQPMSLLNQDIYHRPLVPFYTALKHVWHIPNDLCVTYVSQGQGHPCNRTRDDSWLLFKGRFSGYSPDGYDQNGYDITGFDRYGYDRDGYDTNGYNRFDRYDNSRIHRPGTCRYTAGYDPDGFNIFGFDKRGYNGYGCNYSQKGPHINALVVRVWKFYFRQRVSVLVSLPRLCPELVPVDPVWIQNMWVTHFVSPVFPDWPKEDNAVGPYNPRLCIDTTPVITSCGCETPTLCPYNPCKGATCHANPNALCRINVCSPSCEAFWIWDGQEILCPEIQPQCELDGKNYNVGDRINTEDPCQDCQCESEGIRCVTATCRPLNCVHKVQLPGQCCSVCQDTPECHYQGKFFQHGDVLPSRHCERCVCQSGEVKCSRMTCESTRCRHPATSAGACCPECSDCHFGNQLIKNNESVIQGCETCQCVNGTVRCQKLPCPELTCPNTITTDAKCCPTCPSGVCYHGNEAVLPGQSVVVEESCQECFCSHSQLVCGPIRCPATDCRHPSNDPCCPLCQGCRYEGLEYKNDESFVDPRQPCLRCHCRDGNVVCHPQQCRPVRCTHPQLSADGCCPLCQDCQFKNKTYRNNQRFQDGCETCFCERGSVHCQPVQCPPVTCSHPTSVSCCLSCDHGCDFQDRTIREGQAVTSDDPCESCQCIKGDIRCSQLPCPSVTCSHPATNECCFECNNCLIDGQAYTNGQSVRSDDPCGQCICQRGNRMCRKINCPAITCSHPIQGQCCRECSSCQWNGQMLRDGDTVQSSPCETCTCSRGSVTCQRVQCPEVKCHNPTQGQCCRECSGCQWNGQMLRDGDTVQGSPCETCTCSRGSVTCQRVQCPEVKCHNPTQGQCCRECSGCQWNGQMLRDGDTVQGSPCETCTCSRGSVTCQRVQCPEVKCRNPTQGQCCRECSSCQWNGQMLRDGDTVQGSPCETCTCSRGSVTCQRDQCPEVKCHNPTQGQCCRECSGCQWNGQMLRDGDTVQGSPCETCTCSRGSVTCQRVQCPEVKCRNPTQGQCCLTCDQGCAFQGREVAEGQSVPSNQPCETCLCNNGDIRCSKLTCPQVNCSHPIRGHCCLECMDCLVNGTVYENGRPVTSENPCDQCICQRGNLVCQRIDCPAITCSHPLQGQCCRECSGCQVNGEIFRDEDVISRDQTCETCQCRRGNFFCDKRCPAVTCPYPTPGRCCPSCDNGCLYEGRTIPEGDNLPASYECQQCKCSRGFVVCSEVTCPPLDCTNPVLELPAGECCPVCRGCLYEGMTFTNGQQFHHGYERCICERGSVRCEVAEDCNIGGQIYENGQKIMCENPCEECVCERGREICWWKECPTITCTDPIQGRCCRECNGCQRGGLIMRNGERLWIGDCESCHCVDGNVTCGFECPAELNCCAHEGKLISEGTTVSTLDPCQQCKCSGGSIRCSSVQCPTISCTHPVQGRCCQECNRCLYQGNTYVDGEVFRGSKSCEECRCSRGSITCGEKVCPPVLCQHPVQGECCLQCKIGCQNESVKCEPNSCPPVTCSHPVKSGCCDECTSCQYEDLVYEHGHNFASSDSCLSCTCLSGTVGCTKIPCKDLPLTCRNPSLNHCGCQICGDKTCQNGGYVYQEDDSVPSIDKCETCRCQDGRITCQSATCQPVTCRNPVQDGCCPECNRCSYHGNIYSDGQEIDHPEDKCSVCICQLGNVYCQIRPCPAATCPNPIFDGCCQKCPAGCLHNNITLVSGQSVVDHCRNCTCENGVVKCRNVVCPPLKCRSPEVVPRQCCPICRTCTIPSTGEKLRPGKTWIDPNKHCHKCLCKAGKLFCQQESCDQCIHHGLTRLTGDKWKVDECTSCQCDRGQVRCQTQRCQSLTCSDQSTLTMLPGRCCPVCKPKPRTCIGFGDPHYLTFDGQLLHFQGLCTYVMTADCVGGQFQVRAKHDERGSQGRVSWIHSLQIDVTLNSTVVTVDLLPGGQTKVNGDIVTLPFLYGLDLSLEQRDASVILNTRVGVQVIWSGDGYAELSVSSQFRNNLCGLCGNFNGFYQDDLKTREGKMVSSDAEFGKSWKVEDNNCTDDTKDIHPCTSAGYRINKYAVKKCEILKGEVFAKCHPYVRAEEFYASCLYDVCGCADLNREKSLCDVLTSYVRECSRAGINLNWRSPQLCGVGCPTQSGLLWDECGPTCARTCDNRDLPVGQLSKQCIKPCVPGCHCPAHLVLHNGVCIRDTNCP